MYSNLSCRLGPRSVYFEHDEQTGLKDFSGSFGTWLLVTGIIPYELEPTKPCSSSVSEDDESAGDDNSDSSIEESRLNGKFML